MADAREMLPGSSKRAAAGGRLIGRTSPGEIAYVTIVLRPRDAIPAEELRQHAMHRPHERPQVDHDSFARHYGASDEGLAAVRGFAASFGLTVALVDQTRRIVELSGTVSNLEQAFGTELHNCAIGAGVYRGRRGPILLPSEIRPHVEAVLGLDNRPVAKPRVRPRTAGLAYYPQEIGKLYGFPDVRGDGSTVALIELGGNYDLDDLATYFTASGIGATPAIRTVNVGQHVPVPYGKDPDSDGEVMLDIEVVGAIAPGASIVVYFADNTDDGFYQAVSMAVHDPATTAISISWGSPEKDWSAQSMDAWSTLGKTATLRDVPIFAAAGDHGCADELNTDSGYDAQRHADFPGTCDYGVFSCGGTALVASKGVITAETVWNDRDGWATGGGISVHFAVPEWQSGLSAEDGSSLKMRGVPDVAGVADPNTGIRVRVNGTDGVSGGTSAVAPQWAALSALMAQQLGRKPGFFLPLLYRPSAPGATHDIVQGNNSVFGVTGFSAKAGWDACSGLGSPHGANLLALIAPGGPRDQESSSGATIIGTSGTSSGGSSGGPAPRPGTAGVFNPSAAVLYGRFVTAAYSMYDADPHNCTPAPSADFPASHDLIAWIQMQDFIIGRTGPTFYGFIAKSIANPNSFILALRGTSDGVEWWDDANSIVRTEFRVPNCGSVGLGFARIYDTLEVIERPSAVTASGALRSLRAVGGFSHQVASLISRHAPTAARAVGLPPSASVEITGHSLGAALATLYTMENAKTDRITSPMLCTFASPLVGDSTFVAAFNALGLTSWRIVNDRDIVPKLPPEILGFRHVDTLQSYDSAGKVKPSLRCWHSMATYLSLIDPALAPSPACRLGVASAIPPEESTKPGVSTSIPESTASISITVNVGNR